jgi:DNA-binding Lrp family transcriptional regulator
MNRIQGAIFLSIYASERPMLKSHIAKGLGVSHQVITYNLKGLLNDGIVEQIEGKYQVNPVYNAKESNEIILPLVETILFVLIDLLPSDTPVKTGSRKLKNLIAGFLELKLPD